MTARWPDQSKMPILQPVADPELDLKAALHGLKHHVFRDYLKPASEPPFSAGVPLAAILSLERAITAVAQAISNDALVLARAARDEFVAALPTIEAQLHADLAATFSSDPAAQSPLEIVLGYPGLWALLCHRVAHALKLAGVPIVPRLIAQVAHRTTAIDIHPGAKIGPGCFIDHGTGIVIGETAEIGSRVTLFHGVTLGARSLPKAAAGAIPRGLPRHPMVGDDVILYAGATVLGRITIGAGSVIGGGLLVTRSLPPHTRFVTGHPWADQFSDGAGI